MVKKLLILYFILLAIPIHAQWVIQNSGVFAVLNDVYCISEDVVVVVGDAGTILKTTDGGANWVQKNSGSTYNLMKVQFLNSSIGFTVGGHGTLLKTTDGGESWTSIVTGETLDFYGLSVSNENIFYISGEDGLIKKTNNGGVSFVTQTAPINETIKCIQYLNETIGYAQGNVLYKTFDGGTSWESITQNYVASFFFLNENTGFVDTMGSGIYKTTDGGLNLIPVAPSYAMTSGSLFVMNENVLWNAENSETLCGCSRYCIVKNDISNPEEYHQVENCNLEGDFGPAFNRIYFASETKGYAVGRYGAIYKNSTGTMLGVDEIHTKAAVRIYPNPASDYTTISFTQAPTEAFSIEITDNLGKIIYSKSYRTENSVTLNTESFSKGIYFLKILSAGKSQIQKLIIE